MIEMVQFLKWVGRKVFRAFGAFGALALTLFPRMLKRFRKLLNENFTLAMVLWIIVTCGVWWCGTVGLLLWQITDATLTPRVWSLFVVGISLGILVIIGCQALYDAFKADQQRVIEALRCKEYGNQEINEE